MTIRKSVQSFGLIKGLYNSLKDSYYCVLTVISPELNTRARYKAAFGRKLDLNNPKTLNEKILWLKLNMYMSDPLVIQCADKYKVREYVKSCGCEDILNELIGVWESVDEIPWDDLPNQFVLKWNFGAGMNIVCTDKQKMNKNEVLKQIEDWRKEKFWLPYAEMQYKYIEKKIICERLLNAMEASR